MRFRSFFVAFCVGGSVNGASRRGKSIRMSQYSDFTISTIYGVLLLKIEQKRGRFLVALTLWGRRIEEQVFVNVAKEAISDKEDF